MAEQLPLPLEVNPSLDFSQYWAGPNLEVLEHLKNGLAQGLEPFIFLWGEKSSGKTHLLNACCAKAHGLGHTAVYLPLTMVNAYGPSVLEGIEEQTLVCLDDVDVVLGQDAWELSLFHLFNELKARQNQLIMSASLVPASLGIKLADLRSRLDWGLTLKLQNLNDEDKAEVLCLKSRGLGLELPLSVAQYLIHHYDRDLGLLMALLDRLDRASLAAQRKVTIPFVKSQLLAQTSP
jgi:DnaA family protein